MIHFNQNEKKEKKKGYGLAKIYDILWRIFLVFLYSPTEFVASSRPARKRKNLISDNAIVWNLLTFVIDWKLKMLMGCATRSLIRQSWITRIHVRKFNQSNQSTVSPLMPYWVERKKKGLEEKTSTHSSIDSSAIFRHFHRRELRPKWNFLPVRVMRTSWNWNESGKKMRLVHGDLTGGAREAGNFCFVSSC